jgi:hypothetical protein
MRSGRRPGELSATQTSVIQGCQRSWESCVRDKCLTCRTVSASPHDCYDGHCDNHGSDEYKGAPAHRQIMERSAGPSECDLVLRVVTEVLDAYVLNRFS